MRRHVTASKDRVDRLLIVFVLLWLTGIVFFLVLFAKIENHGRGETANLRAVAFNECERVNTMRTMVDLNGKTIHDALLLISFQRLPPDISRTLLADAQQLRHQRLTDCHYAESHDFHGNPLEPFGPSE